MVPGASTRAQNGNGRTGKPGRPLISSKRGYANGPIESMTYLCHPPWHCDAMPPLRGCRLHEWRSYYRPPTCVRLNIVTRDVPGLAGSTRKVTSNCLGFELSLLKTILRPGSNSTHSPISTTGQPRRLITSLNWEPTRTGPSASRVDHGSTP